MALFVDQDALGRAFELNRAGDVEGAYRVLATAGDRYAAAAIRIVDTRTDPFDLTVVNLWESVQPGSVNNSWHTVAQVHQRQYLNLIRDNELRLPNTFAIEQSYARALDEAGISRSAAIDLVINTANIHVPEGGPLGLMTRGDFRIDWYDVLHIDQERVADRRLSVEGLTQLQAIGILAKIGFFTAVAQTDWIADSLMADPRYLNLGTLPGLAMLVVQKLVAELDASDGELGFDSIVEKRASGGPDAVQPLFIPLAHHDNGGVASLVTSDGRVAETREGSRYTTQMLDHYGVLSRPNGDGVYEARTTFGGTIRMLGDQLGFDGQWGIQGTWAQLGEGLGAGGTGPGVGGSGSGSGGGSSGRGGSGGGGGSRGGGGVGRAVTEAYDAVARGVANLLDLVGADGRPGIQNAFSENSRPVLLDLDGLDGVEVTPLARSTVFMDASGSGLAHRTAWAGAGDGVLFFGLGGDGLLTGAREFVFTEWDATAADDLAAPRARFDSNGDGRLTAADAEWALPEHLT